MDQQTLLILYVGVMIAAMYFLFIGPQRRQRKQMAEMLANLALGDEVVTAGGVYGKVRAFEEETIWLEVAEGVQVKLAKSAIVAVVPKTAPGETTEE